MPYLLFDLTFHLQMPNCQMQLRESRRMNPNAMRTVHNVCNFTCSGMPERRRMWTQFFFLYIELPSPKGSRRLPLIACSPLSDGDGSDGWSSEIPRDRKMQMTSVRVTASRSRLPRVTVLSTTAKLTAENWKLVFSRLLSAARFEFPQRWRSFRARNK